MGLELKAAHLGRRVWGKTLGSSVELVRYNITTKEARDLPGAATLGTPGSSVLGFQHSQLGKAKRGHMSERQFYKDYFESAHHRAT